MVKFYRCGICGKVIAVVKDGAGQSVCCGKAMQLLSPGTVDASSEKHVPSLTVGEGRVVVKVGVQRHPMEEAHRIEWICLETESSLQFKYLKPGEEPLAVFALGEGEKPVRVYSYCNLHGLWAY